MRALPPLTYGLEYFHSSQNLSSLSELNDRYLTRCLESTKTTHSSVVKNPLSCLMIGIMIQSEPDSHLIMSVPFSTLHFPWTNPHRYSEKWSNCPLSWNVKLDLKSWIDALGWKAQHSIIHSNLIFIVEQSNDQRNNSKRFKFLAYLDSVMNNWSRGCPNSCYG